MQTHPQPYLFALSLLLGAGGCGDGQGSFGTSPANDWNPDSYETVIDDSPGGHEDSAPGDDIPSDEHRALSDADAKPPGDAGSTTAVEDDQPGPNGESATVPELVRVDGRWVEPRQPTQLAAGWNEIRPGGETGCANGSDYVFHVRPGTVNRVLLYIQGGGACWNAATCRLPIYNQDAGGPHNGGILDPSDSRNPFRDWHIVFAPYCTADVFLGNADRNYLGRRVQHRGFLNGEAVRRWVYENITAPEFAFVSGCSAGAVGAMMHGVYVAEAYRENPHVDTAIVADSFQGLVPTLFTGLESWNVASSIPPWLPELHEQRFAMDTAIFMAAPRYPNALISHFNYANDQTQINFYAAMGGASAPLVPRRIRDTVHALADELPNYRYFLAPGTNHCVFENHNVFDTSHAGQNLGQWLGRIAYGDDVPSVE